MGEARPLRLRFTKNANRQLNRVLDYIAARNPAGARNVQERIMTFLNVIATYPETGMLTETVGLRRLIVERYRYVSLYRVGATEVVISTIRQTARRRIA